MHYVGADDELHGITSSQASHVSNMWRAPCLTLLPVATAVTHVYAQRSTSYCQSQRLGTDTVEPTAELKLVQVVFRCV